MWNFKGRLWNFTHNYEPIHRKICILLLFSLWFTISWNCDVISLIETAPCWPVMSIVTVPWCLLVYVRGVVIPYLRMIRNYHIPMHRLGWEGNSDCFYRLICQKTLFGTILQLPVCPKKSYKVMNLHAKLLPRHFTHIIGTTIRCENKFRVRKDCFID